MTTFSVTAPSLLNEFVTKKGIPVVPQPPYSPDLNPCVFFLFPKLKSHLKGRHFETVDNIQKVVTEKLRALPHKEFQNCYREWVQRLRRRVASLENYFEGDNVDLSSFWNCGQYSKGSD
jgi:transposase